MSDNSWYEKGDLPPVGSKCKFTGFDERDRLAHERVAKGQEVEIVCHFDAQACRVAGFLFKGKRGEVFIGQSKYDYFEPIKTERELAVDDLKIILRDSTSPYFWFSDYALENISKSLCDAGYRKTTPD